MFLVYPLLGYLADVYLTRYRTLKCGLVNQQPLILLKAYGCWREGRKEEGRESNDDAADYYNDYFIMKTGHYLSAVYM